jgi:hypothetical protein
MADGTCDLTKELTEEYGVVTVPGHLVFPGGKEYMETLTWDAVPRDEFYADLKKRPDEYATSPANVEEFYLAMEPYAAEGDDMIVCTIKKDASGELTIPAKYDDKTVIALISEDKTNEGVTSLTVEDGVSYIDSCFAESSKALAALSLPESLTGIYQSFNKCEALNALSAPSGLKDLSNSFCDCANLAKIETSGYLHDLTGSFNNTPKLADVTIGGSIQKLESSFNKCGLTALSFTENVHGISDSFNDCPALASITLDQIAGSVSKAFVKCPKLTTLTYKQGGERIGYSFNDNALLEKVDFGGGVGNIFNSFQNCPKYKLPETPAE